MDGDPAVDAAADLTFVDRGVLFDDTLVVADLHVGRGAASNVSFPVGNGTEMIDRLRELVATHDPSDVVVAGDLLHAFDVVPRTVERVVTDLVAAARDGGARVIVTPGNHDTMLDSVWSGPTEPEYRVGDTVVCHGHERPNATAARYVIGHDHPTITIEGQRRPCYLVGEEIYDGADVVVLPSFNGRLRGVEVNTMRASEFMSPLVTDADAFAPVVYDDASDEALSFPPLGAFRHRL